MRSLLEEIQDLTINWSSRCRLVRNSFQLIVYTTCGKGRSTLHSWRIPDLRYNLSSDKKVRGCCYKYGLVKTYPKKPNRLVDDIRTDFICRHLSLFLLMQGEGWNIVIFVMCLSCDVYVTFVLSDHCMQVFLSVLCKYFICNYCTQFSYAAQIDSPVSLNSLSPQEDRILQPEKWIQFSFSNNQNLRQTSFNYQINNFVSYSIYVKATHHKIVIIFGSTIEKIVCITRLVWFNWFKISKFSEKLETLVQDRSKLVGLLLLV